MSANYVDVSLNAVGQDGASLQTGHLHFQVSDLVWVQADNQVVVVEPIDITVNGGNISNGITLPLLAMDNDGYSTGWSWIVSGDYRGVTFPARKLTVNFANGAQQNFADLLAASTLA